MMRFQYSVIRYVPDVVRDEGVNVGVLVRTVGSSEFDFKFLPRSATVRKFSPQADTRLVNNFERELRKSKNEGQPFGVMGRPSDPEFFLKAINEFNGNLQLTEVRGFKAEGMEEV